MRYKFELSTICQALPINSPAIVDSIGGRFACVDLFWFLIALLPRKPAVVAVAVFSLIFLADIYLNTIYK